MTKRKEYEPVKCQKCGREWTPRTKDPARCPGCQSVAWNEPPEAETPKASPEPEPQPAPLPHVIEQLEFDPEWAYKGIRSRLKRKPKEEGVEKPRAKFSERHPELFGTLASILPKSPLFALLAFLLYDAMASLAEGDMFFAYDWYQATWVLPRIVGIFLYPGGPGEWFKLFWPLVTLLVMLAITVIFVIWAIPYRFAFKDYIIIRGNVKVKDARIIWSTDNLWTRIWDRIYGTPPREKVELWLKHKFFWNPILPDRGLVKLTLDRQIEKPEPDGPFTVIAYERRYRRFIALDEMETTDDGQQSREIPLDQANGRFNDRGKLLVWDTQRFSLANPDVRIEKLKRGTHIVPQELKEAADVARQARQEN